MSEEEKCKLLLDVIDETSKIFKRKKMFDNNLDPTELLVLDFGITILDDIVETYNKRMNTGIYQTGQHKHIIET